MNGKHAMLSEVNNKAFKHIKLIALIRFCIAQKMRLTIVFRFLREILILNIKILYSSRAKKSNAVHHPPPKT